MIFLEMMNTSTKIKHKKILHTPITSRQKVLKKKMLYVLVKRLTQCWMKQTPPPPTPHPQSSGYLTTMLTELHQNVSLAHFLQVSALRQTLSRAIQGSYIKQKILAVVPDVSGDKHHAVRPNKPSGLVVIQHKVVNLAHNKTHYLINKSKLIKCYE